MPKRGSARRYVSDLPVDQLICRAFQHRFDDEAPTLLEVDHGSIRKIPGRQFLWRCTRCGKLRLDTISTQTGQLNGRQYFDPADWVTFDVETGVDKATLRKELASRRPGPLVRRPSRPKTEPVAEGPREEARVSVA